MSEHHGGEHGHGHANDQGLSGALRYLRFANRMWQSAVNDAVVAMVAPQPGELIVDLGSGMGAGAMVAARTGARVAAVEPTPFLRSILSARRLTNTRRGQIRVTDGAAEKLPQASGTVNAVFSVNTMHHWVNPDRAAEEIARVLRPGGRVVLADEDFTDPAHPDHEQFGASNNGASNNGDHHHGFTMVEASEMGDRLRTAGLVAIEAEKRMIADRPVIAVLARAPQPGAASG